MLRVLLVLRQTALERRGETDLGDEVPSSLWRILIVCMFYSVLCTRRDVILHTLILLRGLRVLR